ncbi:MAG TPA: hypothetical protein VMV81_00470, partial [Phycisphaerae bacterium]|nr:hypothetical protein [Phycisphaerae bacterium]
MTLESDSSNSGGHRVVQFLARHPKAIVGLVFLILAILGCLLSSTIANQGLQHRIKAIRARHEPVTVDDLNALLPDAPADQNMYPILLRCAQAIEGLEVPREMQDSLPWVGRARYPRSGELLTPEQLSAAKWYLEKQAANLAEIHSALRLKNCGPTSRLTSPLAQRTIPIVPLIHLPEILAIETASRWSVSDGRGNEDRLLEMLPLLGVMKADPFLLAGVIQQCIDRSFVDLVERTLNICPLSESALKT